MRGLKEDISVLKYVERIKRYEVFFMSIDMVKSKSLKLQLEDFSHILQKAFELFEHCKECYTVADWRDLKNQHNCKFSRSD